MKISKHLNDILEELKISKMAILLRFKKKILYIIPLYMRRFVTKIFELTRKPSLLDIYIYVE